MMDHTMLSLRAGASDPRAGAGYYPSEGGATAAVPCVHPIASVITSTIVFIVADELPAYRAVVALKTTRTTLLSRSRQNSFPSVDSKLKRSHGRRPSPGQRYQIQYGVYLFALYQWTKALERKISETNLGMAMRFVMVTGSLMWCAALF